MIAAERIVPQDGIPMPRRRIPQRIFPWQTIKVGHSFVFPANGRSLTKTRRAATSAIWRQHQRQAHTYEVRTVTEDGKDVIRIWRVN